MPAPRSTVEAILLNIFIDYKNNKIMNRWALARLLHFDGTPLVSLVGFLVPLINQQANLSV
jgi:hypothetical protein